MSNINTIQKFQKKEIFRCESYEDAKLVKEGLLAKYPDQERYRVRVRKRTEGFFDVVLKESLRLKEALRKNKKKNNKKNN